MDVIPTQPISRHIYHVLLTLVLITIVTGTVVYHFVEGFSWLDSYYFSVVTLATVGYGDIAPKTDFGKLFTTFYIFAGVGIITAFITATMRRRGERIQSRHQTQDRDRGQR